MALSLKMRAALRQFLNSRSASSVEVNLCLNGMESDMGYASQAEGIAHTDGSCERIYNTPDELLEYMVDGERLRDIITKVCVVSRSI